MWRLLIIVFLALYIIYVIMPALHLCGIICITHRNATLKRVLIPFYYWFAFPEETSYKNSKSNNIIMKETEKINQLKSKFNDK